jgi:hypothetical protein
MANTVKPIAFAVERWMRMPGVGTVVAPGQGAVPRDMFVFSGYADFTGGPEGEALTGVGAQDTVQQLDWIDYSIVEMRVGPRWLRVDGICPMVVVGGHSQLSPDNADGLGFRVQGITAVDLVQTSPGTRRIQLSVDVTVRGGHDGQILTLAYHVTAFGALASPIGNEGIFFAGASDPT